MRLTTNVNGLYVDNNCIVPQSNDIITKLGILEDIEQEFGIDLVILFKAITNGIWVKTNNGISKHLTVALKKRHHTKEYWLFYRPYSHVYLKDYGKTWALTKEELE